MASISHNALRGLGSGSAPVASFSQWNPAAYLATYYSHIEPEERHTLRFLVQEAQRLAPGASVLEFGIGPTLHHVFPFAKRAGEIHVADLLPANLEAVRQWCSQRPGAFNWRKFTREVLIAEGAQQPTEDEIDARERLTRERLTSSLLGDARLNHPLGGTYSRRYDCVVSCYCADSATASKHEWFCYLRNISSLLAPGGRLILTALRNCSFYRVGDLQFPSPAIDEHDLQRALVMLNFDMRSVVLQVCNVPEQMRYGFQSIALASGRIQ
jgi:SAM-dependent methyltransferase